MIFASAFLWVLSFLFALILVTFAFAIIGLCLHFRNEQKAQAWKSRESDWNPLLAAIYLEQSSPEAVWRQISPRESLFFLDYLVQQVERNSVQWRSSDHYQKLCALAVPYLKQAEKKMNHWQAFQRARAADTLGKLAPEFHRPLLRKALEDKNLQVALVAFRALIYQANASDCKRLVQAYGRFQHCQPLYISLLLRHLPPQVATVFMVGKALDTRCSTWERLVALQTLETWPPQPEHAGALAALAISDQDTDVLVKGLLLRVLLRWQTDALLKEVILGFAGHSSDYLRAYAMYALGEYPIAHHAELLELGLSDASRWVAMEAAQSLDRLEEQSSDRQVSLSLLSYSQHHSQDELFV